MTTDALRRSAFPKYDPRGFPDSKQVNSDGVEERLQRRLAMIEAVENGEMPEGFGKGDVELLRQLALTVWSFAYVEGEDMYFCARQFHDGVKDLELEAWATA